MGQNDEFETLVLGLCLGNVESQQDFTEGYSDQMLRAARAFLRKHSRRAERAEDICQAVVGKFFARAQRREIRAASPEKLVSFVAAMIRYEILHGNRRDHAARRDVGRLEDTPVEEREICSHKPDPSRVAEARELWEMCADELGGEGAFVVYEHVCERRTFPEIAEILEKKKPDAVKRQYQRAVKKLRAKFGHHFRPE